MNTTHRSAIPGALAGARLPLIRHPKDFGAGALFILLGGGFCGIALDYAAGTAGRMGPGYFPRVLGLMLAALGVALILRSLKSPGDPIAFTTLRPLVIVLASVLTFGLTVSHLGLVLATVLTVLLASSASHDYRRIESAIAAVSLAVFVVVAFRYGLELQLPTWPTALTD